MIITNTNKELFDMGQIQIKFTEAELKNLKLKKHSYFAYDIKSHGLAIRVYPSGVKTFFYFFGNTFIYPKFFCWYGKG